MAEQLTSPSSRSEEGRSHAVAAFVVFAVLQYCHHYWLFWPGLLLVVSHLGVCAVAAFISTLWLRSQRLRWPMKTVLLTLLWTLAPGSAVALALGDVGMIGAKAGEWLAIAWLPALLLTLSCTTPVVARGGTASAETNGFLDDLFGSTMAIDAYRRLVAALAGYAALAILLTYPAVSHFRTQLIAFEGDSWQNAWNYWWFRTAAFELRVNPYFTDYLFYPTGSSLIFHTLQPFHGLLAAPIQAIWGLAASYNTIVIFSLIASGLAMYVLAFAVTGQSGPAFVAGVIFTFCPFHMYKCFGHLNFAAAEWIPIYVLAFLKMHVSRRWRWSVAAALALGLNWACSWYYTMYCVLFSLGLWTYAAFVGGPSSVIGSAVGMVTRWLRARRPTTVGALAISLAIMIDTCPIASVRALCVLAVGGLPFVVVRVFGRQCLRRVILFLLLAAVLLGPPLVLGVTSLGKFAGLHTPWRNSCDLLALFLPSSISTYARGSPALTEALGRNWTDRSSYLGLTVALLALTALMRPASRDRSRLWLVVGAAFCVLAFGPHLQVGGRRIAPLPYLLLWRALPILKMAGVPGRMSYMTTFCLAVVVSIGLSSLRGSPRRKTIVCGTSCLLILAEFLCIPPPSMPASVPEFYHQMADDADDYIVIDSAYCQNLYFQTVHGKKMMGGYVSRPEIRAVDFVQSNPITAELLGFPWLRTGRLQATAADVDALRAANVRYIVDHRGRYRRWLKHQLGLLRVHHSPEIDVYDLRGATR